MYVILSLLSLLCLVIESKWENVSLVNQSVTSAATSVGRILTQQLLDLSGQPLLVAADDFTLPASNCTTLGLSFWTLRTRKSADPNNVTLLLMQQDSRSGGPTTQILYHFTRPWNNAKLNVPTQITFLLQQGTLDDGGVTRFSLPTNNNRTLWAAIYVSLALNQSSTGQNAFFWLTSLQSTGSEFYYRDPNNLQLLGFTNWTRANVAGPALGLAERQMAWQVWLQCPPTVAPSMNPTKRPTPVPSFAPTMKPIDNTTNITWLGDPGSSSALAPAIVIPLTLACLCTLVLLAVLWIRRRNHRQNEKIPAPVDIREKLVKPATLSLDDFASRNPFQPNEGRVRVFTSGHEMTSVSLSDSNSIYGEILNDSIARSSDNEI